MANPPIGITVTFYQTIVAIQKIGLRVFSAERLEIHLPQNTDKQAYKPKDPESLQTAFKKLKCLFSICCKYPSN
jgi:hypothetical protein